MTPPEQATLSPFHNLLPLDGIGEALKLAHPIDFYPNAAATQTDCDLYALAAQIPG